MKVYDFILSIINKFKPKVTKVYPTISEYIEAIKMAEDNLKVLKYLQPVLDENGKVVMRGDDSAVVFKMREEYDGKVYAIKCFLKEPKECMEAYNKISETLRYKDETYLMSWGYCYDELVVNSVRTNKKKFPVLLMNWATDVSLDDVDENVDYVVEDVLSQDRNGYYDFLIRFKNGCPLYFKLGDKEGEVIVCTPKYKSHMNLYTRNFFYYADNEEKVFGKIQIPSVINYKNRKYKVVRIGSNAFDGCVSLVEVEIPNSVNKISRYAFSGCTSLKHIGIPDSVQEIGWYAFEGCTSLGHIEIPDSVQEIGLHAFEGCTSLQEVILHNLNVKYDESLFPWDMKITYKD